MLTLAFGLNWAPNRLQVLNDGMALVTKAQMDFYSNGTN